jgi:hypothetical protein
VGAGRGRIGVGPGHGPLHHLRVDAPYNEDPEEQAKALYYLRELFDSQKRDPIRAKECARRLQADKRLAGTVYQRLAAGKDKEK